MRKTAIVAVVLGLFTGAAYADQGSTSAAFLQLDTSPRVIGMGGSFAGLADDVSAIEYNPAGSAFLTQDEVTLTDALWIQGIDYYYAAAALPFSFGTLGADVFYLNAGTFQQTVLQGNTPVVTGSFNASDMYGTLDYSRKILSYLSAGVSVKFLDEQIASYSTGSVAVGLSAFYRSPIPGLGVGLSFNNLGPAEGFEAGYPLPANFRFGVGYKPTADISVDSDYVQYFNTVGTWSIGGEYGYRILIFRLGFQYGGGIDYNEVEDNYGPSVASDLYYGLGVRLFKNYSLDASYHQEGILGTSEVLALNAKF